MRDRVLGDPNQVTATWLTRVLTNAGALQQGTMATMGVYIATKYCRGGVNERRISVRLPMLQRSLTACDDLNCSELW